MVREQFLRLNIGVHKAVVTYPMTHNTPEILRAWCSEEVRPYLIEHNRQVEHESDKIKLADFWTIKYPGQTNPVLACALDNYRAGLVDWAAIRGVANNLSLQGGRPIAPEINYRDDCQIDLRA